jgi:hypothetical protein
LSRFVVMLGCFVVIMFWHYYSCCCRAFRWPKPPTALGRFWLRYSQVMDLSKMLSELRQERDGIDEAIAVLARLAAGQGKRRGRPPEWMAVVKRRGRPPGSKNKAKA